MEFDVLMRHGEVLDGTGGEPRRADIGISGERIAQIGDLAHASARVEVEAQGLAVAPGFIDTHPTPTSPGPWAPTSGTWRLRRSGRALRPRSAETAGSVRFRT